MIRPRPLTTPYGPERTDVDPAIPCPEFHFTIWTEYPERMHELIPVDPLSSRFRARH